MHAVGDGLDPVREQIQQYVFPREQRLPLVLEELKAEERMWLERFDEAEAKGALRLPTCPPAGAQSDLARLLMCGTLHPVPLQYVACPPR